MPLMGAEQGGYYTNAEMYILIPIVYKYITNHHETLGWCWCMLLLPLETTQLVFVPVLPCIGR